MTLYCHPHFCTSRDFLNMYLNISLRAMGVKLCIYRLCSLGWIHFKKSAKSAGCARVTRATKFSFLKNPRDLKKLIFSLSNLHKPYTSQIVHHSADRVLTFLFRLSSAKVGANIDERGLLSLLIFLWYLLTLCLVPRHIAGGGNIQKKRQRSLLLFGGQNLLNPLPR